MERGLFLPSDRLNHLLLETRDRVKDRATRAVLKVLSLSGRSWREADYTSDTPAIVVGGCQRSGTTLMRVLLDSHPNVCCGPESDLFLPRPIFAKRLAFRFDLEELRVLEFRRGSSSRSEFIDKVFGAYCEMMNKPRWAEKSPPNVMQLDYIFKHFPKARFIHMIRDGRDVACSLRVHPRHKVVRGELVKRNTRNPMDICVREWVTNVRRGMMWRGDERYMEVRYEDLTGDTEATVRRILDFIGEPWDEGVLAFHTSESSSRDVTKFPQNPEVTGKIYQSAVAKWRKEMSAGEVELFRRLAGSLLVELGYEKDGRWGL